MAAVRRAASKVWRLGVVLCLVGLTCQASEPPANCVPGPSPCPAAPNGSIFPPPGDHPPGCNSHGCTTIPTTLLPKWPATYQMNLSTIIMPCNGTGPTDPESTKGWAYIDFDWSNWKGIGSADGWAKHKPMDCEEVPARPTATVSCLCRPPSGCSGFSL